MLRRLPLATLVLLALSAGLLRPQGHAPGVAASKMTAADGLAVQLVASEPLVRQPVAIDFDDRGRLWVLQYLQYPNPAGLKRVKVDRYSRTVYDRVPEPPPRGPKGDDRLTILELGPDGKVVKAHDFVSGLNLASGFAFGHGGVFVLQAPYLLFYRSRDGDRADGDPDVLLSGFGMEDAHSVANSLTWGPDGWLYGCQGSTVTARVRDHNGRVVEFQQGVWRYHPLTRKFELFCEGGGNSWGLDFDRHGHLLYSTNHGGFVLLHGVQGGYYWKSFAKHGALHNPHAYGFFGHAPHANFQGGHVTVGGIVYRGGSFPERFRDRYVAADLLGHDVYWHEVEPLGSTFRTRTAGRLLRSNDTWFAPSDVTLGPDGSVYVADWHDKRTAHPDPDAEWDRSNGRVYRISAKGARPHVGGEFDYRKLSRAELLARLSHANDWHVRRARRVLADRRDPEVIFPLRRLVRESKDEQFALEALWALHVSGGLSESFAAELLGHRSPHVRRWAVRLLGDEEKVSPATARKLIDLAHTEPDVAARSQLASTARRLPAEDGLPVVQRLVLRDVDNDDPHIPLLLWWAVEHHVLPARVDVVGFFASERAWRSRLARTMITPRLVRRLAAEGASACLTDAGRLLRSAPIAERPRLLEALDLGLRDAPATPTPAALVEAVRLSWRPDTAGPVLLRLLARLDHAPAWARLRELAAAGPVSARVQALRVLGEVGRPADGPVVLRLLEGEAREAVHLAALEALARFPDVDAPAALLPRYSRLTPAVRARAREVLLSRRAWALALLRAVEARKIDARDFGIEQLRAVALHRDAKLDGLVTKHWGRIEAATAEEKLAEVRRLNNDLRAGPGNAVAGRALFAKHCGTCHKLFGEGKELGPDLTHANRKDREYLLVSIVDPSAVIRKEYLAHSLQTKDGRALTGLLAEDGPGRVVLLDAEGRRHAVPRDRVESLAPSPVSLMPEGLLKGLRPQEVRNLFAYLQK
jgi:putative membrane-bound dehydrogenase-like protein